MDIYCPVCGEPYEMDSLHDEASERYGIPYYLSDADRDRFHRNPNYSPDDYQKVYKQVSTEFRSRGCAVFSWAGPCERAKPDNEYRDPTFGLTSAEAAGALYDTLGDDLDGAAAMMEDLGY